MNIEELKMIIKNPISKEEQISELEFILCDKLNEIDRKRVANEIYEKGYRNMKRWFDNFSKKDFVTTTEEDVFNY